MTGFSIVLFGRVVVLLFDGMLTVGTWICEWAMQGYNPGKTSILTEEVGIAVLVFAVYCGVDFSILRSIRCMMLRKKWWIA